MTRFGTAFRSFLLAVLLVGVTTAPALARMTVTGPFGTGLTEPVWVVQHLLGFLAIGIWAGQNGGPAVWQLPVSALTAVLAAGLAAQVDIRLPYAAQGLSASLIVVGALVALNLRVPLALAVLTVAVASVFHGYVHMGSALFWGGFSAGVLLVTCAGLGLSAVLAQAVSPRAAPVCGGAVALVGVLDLVNVF